jgi:hypothetical protein
MKTIHVKNKITHIKRELVEVLRPAIYISPMCYYGVDDIAESLLIAALDKRSLNGVAKIPDSDTVFWRIKNTITGEIVRDLIKHLRPDIKGKVWLAVDGHDEMCYVKDVDGTPGVVGTKPKAGTHYAYKFLVFKIISGKKEYIVDVIQLFDGSMTEATITALEELRKIYDIDLVVMDGEFHSTRLLNYLTDDAMIDYICRRPSCEALDNLDLKYGNGYRYSELLPLMEEKQSPFDVDYVIYKFEGRKNKKGESKDFYLASNMQISGKKIRKLFKHRWRIETCFREANRVKIKTSTKNSLLRVFFYAISCAIYNIWIRIRSKFRTKPKNNMTLDKLRSFFVSVIHESAVAKKLLLEIIGIEE